MQQKQLLFGFGGLLIGLLIGAFVLGRVIYPDQSAEIARLQQLDEPPAVAMLSDPGFRTVNEAAATSDFFLVTFDQTEKWLTDNEIELSEEQTAQLTAIMDAVAAGDITADTVEKVVTDEESEAHAILKFIYDTILASYATANNLPADAPAPAIAACLGVQDDVYTGTVGFLYLQMPSAFGETTMKITPSTAARPEVTEWQKLDSPMPNSMLWVSACYEGEEKK